MKCQTVRHRTRGTKDLGCSSGCLSTLCGGDLAPHSVCVCVSSNHRKMAKEHVAKQFFQLKGTWKQPCMEFRISVNLLFLTLRVAFEENAQWCPLQQNQTPLFQTFQVTVSWWRHAPPCAPATARCDPRATGMSPSVAASQPGLQFVAVSKSTSTWQPY